jgi:hypothetical protein
MRYPDQPLYKHANLGAGEAWRTKEDAGMRPLTIDGFPGQHEKVPRVAGYQAPALSGGVGQLLGIRELYVALIVGADGIDALLPQRQGNFRREILVQVKLNAPEPLLPEEASGTSVAATSFSSSRSSISSR